MFAYTQVTYADEMSVTLSWFPPFNQAQPYKRCTQCSADGKYTQYAISATIANADELTPSSAQNFGPQHATGN